MILILNADFMRRLAWEQMRLRLSHQVRGLRESRGWTQGDLAKRASLALRDVWRLENGHMKHITIKTLTQISHALDVACDIRFVSLMDSLKQIGQPIELPASFQEETTFPIGEPA